MADIALADGTTIHATAGHPFWDATIHAFVNAGDLTVGDQVLTADGALLAVTGVYLHQQDLTAYNLSITEIHTYYAGDAGVLVHNTDLVCDLALPDDTILVRAGTSTPERFTHGTGVTTDAKGNLSGVSVGSGTSTEAAAAGYKNGQLGVSTVGDVRAAGGTVTRMPSIDNPGHCLNSGCSAQTLSDLFTPTIPNIWRP
jgi:hypothetical protein